jgi:hypothetical protein
MTVHPAPLTRQLASTFGRGRYATEMIHGRMIANDVGSEEDSEMNLAAGDAGRWA